MKVNDDNAFYREVLIRLDLVEERLKDLFDIYQTPIKIPHRCPSCCGSKFDLDDELCNVCDGKGIVWG